MSLWITYKRDINVNNDYMRLIYTDYLSNDENESGKE
jgi:hypothetical protein